jgi:tRNA(Arg) A34 adenosine deaminase TadA
MIIVALFFVLVGAVGLYRDRVRIRAYLRWRAAERCAAGKHSWGADMSALEAFPERAPIEHLMCCTLYYTYSRCKHCTQIARRVRG